MMISDGQFLELACLCLSGIPILTYNAHPAAELYPSCGDNEDLWLMI